MRYKARKLYTFLYPFVIILNGCFLDQGPQKKIKAVDKYIRKNVTPTKSIRKAPRDWTIKFMKGDTLFFDDNNIFKTFLFDPKYIYTLNSDGNIPFFIFSGRSCTDCDENLSIFIISPFDTLNYQLLEKHKYSYPGKELDYADNRLSFASRMFYRKGSKGSGEVVWLQKSRDGSGNYSNSLFIVNVINDHLHEDKRSIDSNFLKKISSDYKELLGIQFTSEP